MKANWKQKELLEHEYPYIEQPTGFLMKQTLGFTIIRQVISYVWETKPDKAIKKRKRQSIKKKA